VRVREVDCGQLVDFIFEISRNDDCPLVRDLDRIGERVEHGLERGVRIFPLAEFLRDFTEEWKEHVQVGSRVEGQQSCGFWNEAGTEKVPLFIPPFQSQKADINLFPATTWET
jgi:hypothetical protein